MLILKFLVIDVTCVGRWIQSLNYDAEQSHDPFAQGEEGYDHDHADVHVSIHWKSVNIPKEVTNLIVRGSDRNSYCIQYSSKKNKRSYPIRGKVSNDTDQELKFHKSLLEVKVFKKECHSFDQDNLVVLKGNLIQRNKAKLGILMSNNFIYKEPCQAALTDAASISKAALSKISLNKQGRLSVIMVLILPGILYIFSTRMKFDIWYPLYCN